MVKASKEASVLRSVRIGEVSHPLYEWFWRVYTESFPVFERRTEAQQRTALATAEYALMVYTRGEQPIGFVGYWEFDSYLYIEHLAIDVSCRGKGYGCMVLELLINSTHKDVLLEIDPIVDTTSQARLRFYEQCGFVTNPYLHRHPPYRSGYMPHELIVLSLGRGITEAEYRVFVQDLKGVVMDFEVEP